jgi:hypothetical protein
MDVRYVDSCDPSGAPVRSAIGRFLAAACIVLPVGFVMPRRRRHGEAVVNSMPSVKDP